MRAGGQRPFVKAKTAVSPLGEKEFEAKANAAKCQIGPGDCRLLKEADLQTLLACRIVRRSKVAAVEEVNLVDMRQVDHQKGVRVNDRGARLFLGLAKRCLSGGLAVFHKTCGQGPETKAWFNGPAAKENLFFPRGDAANHHAGVFILNVIAGGALVAWSVIAGRHREYGAGAALVAETDHGLSLCQ